MRARLIPVDGGPPVELVKDLTLVGRGDDCDMRVDHKSISKRHCVLVKTDGLVIVRDLGSTNGTRVNGQRVRRASLLPNDQLAVANFRYLVKFGEGPGKPAEDSLLIPVASDDADDSEDGSVKQGGPAIQVNELPDIIPDKS